MKQPDVHIHIERIVLDGFEHINRERIGNVITGELTRLIAEQGYKAAPGATHGVHTLNAGSIAAAPDERSESLGVKIANAVYGGLNK